MITVKDSLTGKTFEVPEEHYNQVLYMSTRYQKTEPAKEEASAPVAPRKPRGRPKKTQNRQKEE